MITEEPQPISVDEFVSLVAGGVKDAAGNILLPPYDPVHAMQMLDWWSDFRDKVEDKALDAAVAAGVGAAAAAIVG